jgi:hypothetical protein
MSRPSSWCATVLVASCAAAPLAAQWGPVAGSNPPSERAGALFAYDLIGNRMLLFGGNWTNELWSLQNGVWTQLTGATSPGPRQRAALATDTLNGTTLLYGGDAANGGRLADDETWELVGGVWTQLAPTQTPGGFARHAMAYDGIRQTTVLFGGRRDSWAPYNISAQTWEFALGNWTAIAPTQSPPARVDAAMAFHPVLNQVLLFGGEDANGNGLGDTWLYDGVTWNQVNTAGPAPAPRTQGKLVPLITRGVCALFGGRDPLTMVIHNDTWEHDGAAWRQVQNVYGGVYPARDEFAIAHDLVRDRLVLFGGRIANNSQQNDTWEYGAQFARFGSGCAGTAGVPTLVGGQLPRLGTVTTAQLTNLPATSQVALMAVGLSRTQWAFGSLPALLTPFGMPSCRTYTSADVLVAIAATGGTAVWSWSVPSWSGFLGQPFHLQGLSLDAAANAGGLTVSNAATIVIGQ